LQTFEEFEPINSNTK